MASRIAAPDDHVRDVGRDADQRQSLAQGGDHEGTQDGADRRARAAEERGAADHRPGDGVQVQTGVTRAGVRLRVQHGKQHAGKGRQRAGQHEVDDLGALYANTDLLGSLQVGAHGDGVQAEDGLLEHVGDGHGPDHRPDEDGDVAQVGELEAGVRHVQVVAEELLEGLGIGLRQLLAVGHVIGEAVQEEERAQGRDQRGHPEPHRDGAVDKPDESARKDGQGKGEDQRRGRHVDAEEDQRQGEAVVEEVHHEGGDAVDLRGREIDLAGDHHQHLGQGEDAVLAGQPQDVGHLVEAEEVRVNDLEDHAHDDGHDADADFAILEQKRYQGARNIGPVRGCYLSGHAYVVLCAIQQYVTAVVLFIAAADRLRIAP